MSMLLSFFVILLVLNMAWLHKWKTSIRLFSIDINGVLIHKTFNYSMFIWYIYLCNQVMNVCSVVFKCLHPYTYPYAKLIWGTTWYYCSVWPSASRSHSHAWWLTPMHTILNCHSIFLFGAIAPWFFIKQST